MSRLLLDTTTYSAMRRGDDRPIDPVREASEVALTPVVLGELVHGFAGGRLEQEHRRMLRAFLDTERVRVMAIDEETAERYAAIRDHLRRQGTPIPTNDLWIAASAAQHGLTVLSLDKHFRDVPQILLLYFAPQT
jgi:tRNA(fMet)-specific endonuclease VapC